jgi:hypothetical protein
LNLFHPDRAAGLGFLSGSVFAIAPVLACQTVVLGGMIGQRIWHAGAALLDFKMEMACVIFFLMLVALVPLNFFVGRLVSARLEALGEIGILASHYVDAFRWKWIRLSGQQEGSKTLLGADIQSLADLGTAYAAVSDMRILPVSLKTIVRLGIFIAAPLTPLALTMMPLHKMVDGLIRLLF